MMDECEILKNLHEAGNIKFDGFDDCVKKAKEGTVTSPYAAVAVWDKIHTGSGRAKFDHPGTLYFKSYVPKNSDDADANDVDWFNNEAKNKTLFWRPYSLMDFIDDKDFAVDIQNGVIEMSVK